MYKVEIIYNNLKLNLSVKNYNVCDGNKNK